MSERDKQNLPTIIWTYSSREEEVFKKTLLSLDQKYKFETRESQLIVLAQKQIAFKVESGQTNLIVKAEKAAKDEKESYLEEIELSDQTVFLSHNLQVVEGAENIPASIRVLDYSSADQSHHRKMLQDLRQVTKDAQLVRLAHEWVDIYFKEYNLELVQYAKQYALNLFLTLSIDVRSVQNIWNKSDLDRLKKLLEKLSGQWEGEPAFIHSPYSQLLRLWYLLVGKDFNWEKSGLRPPADVVLPKDRHQKVEQSLWGWVNFFYGDFPLENSKAWPQILYLSGLKSQGGKFEENCFASIVNFIKIFQVIAKSESPDRWLQVFMEIAGFAENIEPLDYLWFLLAKGESEPREPLYPGRVKPDYSQITSELSRLKLIRKEPAINCYFEWLYQLSMAFEELKEEIKNLKSV